MRSIGQNILNIGFSVMSQLMMFGSGFIVFILLVKQNDTVDFGIWALFMTVLSIADTFRQGFVHEGFVKKYVQSDRKDFIVTQYVYINYGLIILTSVIMYAVSPLLAEVWHAPMLNSLLELYFLMGLTLGTLQLLGSITVAKKDHLSQFRINLIYAVTIVTALCTLYYIEQPITPHIIIYIHGMAGVFLVVFLLVKNKVFNYKISPQFIKEAWNYGRFTSGTGLLSLLFHKADIILIGIYINPLAVGLYHVATKIVNYVELPMTGIAQVYYPRFSDSESDKLPYLYVNCLYIMLAFTLTLCFGVLFFSDQWIILISGIEYLNAQTALTILLMGTIVKPFGRVFGLMLNAVDKPKINFQLLSISVLVNGVLNIFLIPVMGINGAALATSMSIIITIGIGQSKLHNYLSITAQMLIQPIKDLKSKFIININNL